MQRTIPLMVLSLGLVGQLLVNGCASRTIIAASKQVVSETNTKRIGIMPFLKGKHYTNIDDPTDMTLNCKLDELCFITDDIESRADKILTRFMGDALKKKFSEKLIPPHVVMEAYDRMSIKRNVDTPRSLAVRLGKELGAEHIVLGVVWRYRDRVGTAMAVDRPASVAFAIYVIHIETKERVWKRVFEMTQQSLSENILNAPDFFKHGAKWLTASELALLGVEKIVKNLPLK